MPMLAAMAVPSTALRAKDVVISWSPLGFFQAQATPVGGMAAAGLGGQAANTVRLARGRRLGLAGALDSPIWTGGRWPSSSVHPAAARLALPRWNCLHECS